MTNPKDLVGAKKAPMDLVPAAGAIMSAPAHQNGADKYGPFNWRLNPVQLMTYLAAARRHLDAFIDGQDVAEDTGIHHLSHMLAGLNIVADAMALGNLIDNRPPKGPAADMLRAQDKSAKVPVEAGHYCAEQFEAWALSPEPVPSNFARLAEAAGVLPAETVQECPCPTDWPEHGFGCPLYHVERV